jgi:hypothetical protein
MNEIDHAFYLIPVMGLDLREYPKENPGCAGLVKLLKIGEPFLLLKTIVVDFM